MNLSTAEQIMVQVRFSGEGWSDFREFNTEEEAHDYAQGDGNSRVVKRTVVTIAGEWEVVP